MSDGCPKAPAVPLVFGDVSILRYPNGDEVLGGHAFAIAWHLQGLGCPALLISRVGEDAAGDAVLHALRSWDASTVGIQRATGQSTDTAPVQSGDATPTGAPPDDRAWDRICAADAIRALGSIDCALVVHGTRCLRSAYNRHTLDELIETSGAPVFFDAADSAARIDAQVLERCMVRTKWVTFAQSELPTIAAALNLARAEPQRIAERLRERYDMAAVFVTASLKGSYAIGEANRHQAVVPSGDLDAVDRLGVKEAFSAIAVNGLLAGWPIAQILQRAQSFVELMAALPGPEIPTGGFYDDVREQWTTELEHEDGDRAEHSAIRANAPLPEATRLPAQLDGAADTLEDLGRRRESARMRVVAATQQAKHGVRESRKILTRARRSLENIGKRIQKTRQRLRSLKRTAKKIRNEGETDHEDIGHC